jgi:regulator of sigma E protease
MNGLIAIIGLLFLILVHEAGHFFTALAVRMRPRKFYVGFPPAIAKKTYNGVEYGIGAIPLGGYVKIPGMHRPGPGDVDTYFGSAEREAPELVGAIESAKRAVEAKDLVAARAALPTLESALDRASISPGAKRLAERGLRELADSLSDDAYWRQPAWRKIAVIGAGPGTNLLFAILLFAVLFMLGTTRATSTIDEVTKDSPAQAAGFRGGDRVVQIDGRPVAPEDIARSIVQSKGRPLRMTVDRRGMPVELTVRARRTDGTYRIGIALHGEEGPGKSVPAAVGSSLGLTWDVTTEIGKTLLRLSRGEGRDEISSPVGIVRGSSQALQQGFQSYLFVLGLISLSLALLNLLPLLPLDGGHIAVSIAERIRGRAVSRHVYEKLSAVGLAIVLLLFFTGLSNDLGG